MNNNEDGQWQMEFDLFFFFVFLLLYPFTFISVSVSHFILFSSLLVLFSFYFHVKFVFKEVVHHDF